jgi:hypothetical protein
LNGERTGAIREEGIDPSDIPDLGTTTGWTAGWCIVRYCSQYQSACPRPILRRRGRWLGRKAFPARPTLRGSFTRLLNANWIANSESVAYENLEHNSRKSHLLLHHHLSPQIRHPRRIPLIRHRERHSILQPIVSRPIRIVQRHRQCVRMRTQIA